MGIGAAIGVISALVPVVRGSIDMRDPLGNGVGNSVHVGLDNQVIATAEMLQQTVAPLE